MVCFESYSNPSNPCNPLLLSGTVDECNSTIGLAVSYLSSSQSTATDEDLKLDRQTLQSRLQTVQQYMFDLGANLATPRATSSEAKCQKTVFSKETTTQLETWIDDMDSKLTPLTTFILPGGHPSSASLHLARTVARRAERMITPLLSEHPPQIDQAAYIFLNRLSDFLFVAARFANRVMGLTDITWEQNGGSAR